MAASILCRESVARSGVASPGAHAEVKACATGRASYHGLVRAAALRDAPSCTHVCALLFVVPWCPQDPWERAPNDSQNAQS